MLTFTAVLVNGVATFHPNDLSHAELELWSDGTWLMHYAWPGSVGFDGFYDFDSTRAGVQRLANDASSSVVVTTAGGLIDVSVPEASTMKARVTADADGVAESRLYVGDRYGTTARDFVVNESMVTFGSLVLTYNGFDALHLAGNTANNDIVVGATPASTSRWGQGMTLSKSWPLPTRTCSDREGWTE